MDIFDLLHLIGGMCLFLFGMYIMGESLERHTNNNLRLLLTRLTKKKSNAFLSGLGLTAIIQSSSVAIVMLVGFVNSGLMNLQQSIGVILGANIGTTITAWIFSLCGVTGNSMLSKIVKPMSFIPVFSIIGIVFLLFGKKIKSKDIGKILMGFTTLMFGMIIMTRAVSEISEYDSIAKMFVSFQNPFIGVLVGILVTAIIQSSSASIGILQALAVTGQINYAMAIPLILGQNIGTCVTALLSSVGANRKAKRVAILHLLFNVIGTVFWLVTFCIVEYTFRLPFFYTPVSLVSIAMIHSAFNIGWSILLFPFTKYLEKLAYLIIPVEDEIDINVELDDRLLITPQIALEQAKNVTIRMANFAKQNVVESINMLESLDFKYSRRIRYRQTKNQYYEQILEDYLVKLGKENVLGEDNERITRLLKVIVDFENITDYSIRILDVANEIVCKKINFSKEAISDINILKNAVLEIVTLTRKAFESKDLEEAKNIAILEQTIDLLRVKARNNHINRLKTGKCTIEEGIMLYDLYTSFRRISEHCVGIANCILDINKVEIPIYELFDEQNLKEKYDELYKNYAITIDVA